jgi:hypothetical protein
MASVQAPGCRSLDHPVLDCTPSQSPLDLRVHAPRPFGPMTLILALTGSRPWGGVAAGKLAGQLVQVVVPLRSSPDRQVPPGDPGGETEKSDPPCSKQQWPVLSAGAGRGIRDLRRLGPVALGLSFFVCLRSQERRWHVVRQCLEVAGAPAESWRRSLMYGGDRTRPMSQPRSPLRNVTPARLTNRARTDVAREGDVAWESPLEPRGVDVAWSVIVS